MASERLSQLVTSHPAEGYPHPNMPTTDSPPSSSSTGKLRKPIPSPSHSRSPSAQSRTPIEPNLYQLQESYRGVPSPLLPPPVLGGGGSSHSRSSSLDRSRPGTPSAPTNYSRPSTPTLMLPGQSPQTPDSASKKKEKHGLFGRKKDKDEHHGPMAWIAGHPEKLAYDIHGLANARQVPELWDETDGNCYIYLFSRQSGRGPSFKVDSAIFASSPALTRLAFGDIDGARQPPLDARMQGLSMHDSPLATPPATPKQQQHKSNTLDSASSGSSRDRFSALSFDSSSSEAHLYLPIKLHNEADIAIRATTSQTTSPHSPQAGDKDPATEDLQTLVDIRNFFAFLCGSSLVATQKKHSFFHIFMTIAGILRAYEFSNLDGSTFGEVAASSFDGYVEELQLNDVRTSREKTIEGIVLGERMKSILLYNEAFTHGVGKHAEIVALKSHKFEGLVSEVTKNRLIRAAMDLEKRTASIQLLLTDFDFPALFTGIMNSRVSSERKSGVRFEGWKEAFLGFRKHYIALLKQRYGDWPPKASSKKNALETSGLNRSVLRDVYHDMCSIYDLLVDRTQLTSRTVDGVNPAGAKEEPTISALRAVLSEYDRSSPPVKPPVPFDLPRLPSLKTTRPDFGSDKMRDLKALQKKVKDEELSHVLRGSWNDDTLVTPMLDSFRSMEHRAAKGCTVPELVDLRIGQWTFVYVILQALPMLACDAPGLKWTKGVEYFLCEPPRSGVPWTNPHEAGGGGRTWYNVGEGGGVVSLPSDVVEHGVEGIYRRSHCWTVAEKWTREHPAQHQAVIQGSRAGLGVPEDANSRPSSRQSNRNSAMYLGLEALPMPEGIRPDSRAPSGYSHSTSGYYSPTAAGTRSPSGYHTPPAVHEPRSTSGYHSPVYGTAYRTPPAMPGTRSPSGYASPVGSRPGTPAGERPGSGHVVDANKTFDAILGGIDQGQKGKKGRK